MTGLPAVRPRPGGQAIVVVLLAYVFTFVVISVLPGRPGHEHAPRPAERVHRGARSQRIVAYYGLDQPVLVQLWNSLARFLIGDLGLSLRSNLPVRAADRRGAAVDAGPRLDRAGRSPWCSPSAIAFGTQYLPGTYGQRRCARFPSLFLSVPNFVIGLLLIQLFAFHLGLFRVIDPMARSRRFFAAVALGIPVSAQLAEVLIANLDHEAGQEYAVVARSRGLRRQAVPAPPAQAVVAAGRDGARAHGRRTARRLAHHRDDLRARRASAASSRGAVSGQDLPVLQAVVSLSAVVFVVVNLVADLVYPLLDPRVKLRDPRASAVSADRDPSRAVSPRPSRLREPRAPLAR